MKNILIALLLIFPVVVTLAQDSSRKVKALRTTLPIKIDGNITDPAWNNATVFKDFTEQRPAFGAKESEHTKTEVWMLYDDNAIYVAGFCHENNSYSVST